MGKFNAIISGTHEGKTLFVIRKLAELRIRYDYPIIFFTNTADVMQKCRAYDSVLVTHYIVVHYLTDTSDNIKVVTNALDGREYGAVFVDVGNMSDSFTEYLNELSITRDVYATYQLPIDAIEGDAIPDWVPHSILVPMDGRIIYILKDDVAILGEYLYNKDNTSFQFCRYYYIEIGKNGYPRCDVFGEDFDPTCWTPEGICSTLCSHCTR